MRQKTKKIKKNKVRVSKKPTDRSIELRDLKKKKPLSILRSNGNSLERAMLLKQKSTNATKQAVL